jgi:GNAT superfamily N-acetyltransferase
MSTAAMGTRREVDATGDGIVFTRARPDDAGECVRLRGLTRENAISEERLREYGITALSWAADIESGALPGWVARSSGQLVGYCFGAPKTGEVIVLALHPMHEGKGLGKHLLQLVMQELRNNGHTRLFLGCSADPQVRSYGFYRHLGWQSTGAFDAHGDELLEFTSA